MTKICTDEAAVREISHFARAVGCGREISQGDYNRALNAVRRLELTVSDNAICAEDAARQYKLMLASRNFWSALAVENQRLLIEAQTERDKFEVALLELCNAGGGIRASRIAREALSEAKLATIAKPTVDDHRFAVVSSDFLHPFLLGAYASIEAANKAQGGKPDAWLVYERLYASPIPTAALSPEAQADWRCDECGCRTYYHIDERKPDGSFGHGPDVRCASCKRCSPVSAGPCMHSPTVRRFRVTTNGYGGTLAKDDDGDLVTYADFLALSQQLSERTSELAGCKIALEQAWESNRDREQQLSEARAELDAAKPVAGWIVGNGTGLRWRIWEDGLPGWTNDPSKATRYARREDAETAHHEDGDAWIVVQHPAAHSSTQGASDAQDR